MTSSTGEPLASQPLLPKASNPDLNSTRVSRLTSTLKKQWFLISLMSGIIFAYLYPSLGRKGGPLKTEYTVKYGVVSLIFLLSGLSMKTRVLARTIMMWRLHSVVQFISLCLIPFFVYGVSKLLNLTPINKYLLAGLIVMSSTPTTISSNVVMTKAALGNESAALTNATLGNVLGVFISPLLFYGLISESLVPHSGSDTSVGLLRVFIELGITVILPVIIGQIIQFIAPNKVAFLQTKVNFSTLNSLSLSTLIWSVFCDTFSNQELQIGVGSLLSIIALDAMFFAIFNSFSFFVSRIPAFGFSRPDTVAIMMCAGTKTVSLGIPLLNLLFEGNPNIGVMTIPLLVYHAEQLIFGAILIDYLKSWVESDPEL
ncbi:LRR receptor-like serine/threonine-protein kinase RGI2 [Basidiobolus ranarum]|uniref:LRR receptor-like serine/threonine-protein kinase RGI2 n=1 Tax=Basidiobolus ranarum TaxID=34480 RepID=A0ABR2WNZ4_9FUNG